MDLMAELAAFDGRHTDVLEALAARLEPDETVVHELIRIAGAENDAMQSPATWLLKRFQDRGHAFSTAEVTALLDLLEHVGDWEAKLHLLQTLSSLPIPKGRETTLRDLLVGDGFLSNPNKFVRAWSYNGLAALASQHAAFRPAVAKRLKAAVTDEAPSVRARIRNILKSADWATPD